jgi:CBS domain-containing protein
MRVSELMSSPAISVEPDRPLKDVAETMLHHGISTVPVVDQSGEIVGILSETDLLRFQARRVTAPQVTDSTEVTVAADLMTRAVISTGPNTAFDDLVQLMVIHDVKRVPVVADGRLVGMVSRTDVVRVLTRSDEDIEREVSESLRHDGLLIDPIRFEVSHGVVTFTGISAPGLRAHLEALGHSIAGVIAVEIATAIPDETQGQFRSMLSEAAG